MRIINKQYHGKKTTKTKNKRQLSVNKRSTNKSKDWLTRTQINTEGSLR